MTSVFSGYSVPTGLNPPEFAKRPANKGSCFLRFAAID